MGLKEACHPLQRRKRGEVTGATNAIRAARVKIRCGRMRNRHLPTNSSKSCCLYKECPLCGNKSTHVYFITDRPYRRK